MNYQKITFPDINNGKGCRVTLWVSGCSNRCPGCHNLETWDRLSGKQFDNTALNILFNELDKSFIQGLTLSGGEPLDINDVDKLNNIFSIVEGFRDRYGNTKDIWVYSGFLLEDLIKNPIVKNILDKVDYLVDGKFDINKRNISLPFRGSTNQIIYKKNEFGIFEPDEELNNFRL